LSHREGREPKKAPSVRDTRKPSTNLLQKSKSLVLDRVQLSIIEQLHHLEGPRQGERLSGKVHHRHGRVSCTCSEVDPIVT
jgi:hypothetical protein